MKVTTYVSTSNCSASTRPVKVANPGSTDLFRNATPAALAVDLKGNSDCIYTNGKASTVNYFIGYVEDYEVICYCNYR